MSKFVVGCNVKVADWGRQYSSYDTWFKRHQFDLPVEWLIHYAYDNDNFERFEHSPQQLIDRIYRVLYVDEDICLIGEYGDHDNLYGVFLVHEEGLKLAPRRMTKADIEKALGYEVEIVEDDE